MDTETRSGTIGGVPLVRHSGAIQDREDDPLTADALAELLAEGKSLECDGRTIQEEVHLAGSTILRPVSIRKVIFKGRVDFSQCRFERGVDLTGCRFEGGLVMSDARVEGSLILDGVTFGAAMNGSSDIDGKEPHKRKVPAPTGTMIAQIIDRLERGRRRVRSGRNEPRTDRVRKTRLRLRRRKSLRTWRRRLEAVRGRAGRPPEPTVAEFTNVRVAGCLSLVDATVNGRFSCSHAEVEDDFRIDRARIFGSLLLRRATLGEFRTDGRILSPGASPIEDAEDPCLVHGRIDLTSAKVAGDVRLIGVSVGGEFSLQTAEIEGNVLCRPGARQRTRLQDGAWLYGARVKGVVSLSGTRFNRHISLRTAEIGGAIESNSFGGWPLVGDGDVDLSAARVAADVNFSESRIRGSALLDATRIGTNVYFTGATITGQLSLQNTSIGGTLFCTSTTHLDPNRPCWIGSDAWFLGVTTGADLDISGAHIDGQLVLQNAGIGQNLMARDMGGVRTEIRGVVAMSGIKISHSVFLVGARLDGDLLMDSALVNGGFFCNPTTDREENLPCRIGGKLWMIGAAIAADVDLSGMHVGGDLIMQNASVGQNLLVKVRGGVPTRLESSAHLNGVRVSGAIEFGGVHVQRVLNLDHASVGGDLLVLFDIAAAPDWRIMPSSVGGIQAESAAIGKRVVLMGLTVGSGDHAPNPATAGDPKGVSFTDAQIGREFRLYNPIAARESLDAIQAGYPALPISSEVEDRLLQEAMSERTDIRGPVRLNRAQVLGDVVLDGAIITGELDLRGAVVRADVRCAPVELAHPRMALRAAVRRASFETAEIMGDLVLTGLTIDGDLVLRDTRIRGRLELYPPRQGRPCTECRIPRPTVGGDCWSGEPDGHRTRIGGILDLEAAEVAHAIFCGWNLRREAAPVRSLWDRLCAEVGDGLRRRDYLLFMRLLRGGHPESEDDSQRPSRDAAVLEHSVIGKLEILEPLPGTLYLSDLKAGSWEERPSYFQVLLARSRPFRKSCYVAIEQDLRNQGRDEDADNVHIWMRRRDRRNSRNWGRVLVDRLIDLSTEYGTTSSRLLWVMLGLFAFSVWTFGDRRNVEYDIAPLADTPPPVQNPADSAWSTADAVFMAVRLHVPIVSLGIDEPVQPSGTAIRAYALAVAAASWVMWPLFIASASGLLRRRS